MTAGGIKKPIWFALTALRSLRGEVIAQGSCCCVLRIPTDRDPIYAVPVCSLSDSLKSICHEELAPSEVKGLIESFRDEIHLDVTLRLEPGSYSVIRYSMTQENTLFAHMAALDFRSNAIPAGPGAGLMDDYPQQECSLEEVRTALNLSFTLKGPSLQLAIISRCR